MRTASIFLTLLSLCTTETLAVEINGDTNVTYRTHVNLCEPYAKVAFPVHMAQAEKLFRDETLGIQVEKFLANGREVSPDSVAWVEYDPTSFQFEGGTYIYQVPAAEFLFVTFKSNGGVKFSLYQFPDTQKLEIHYRARTATNPSSNTSLMRLNVTVERRKVHKDIC